VSIISSQGQVHEIKMINSKGGEEERTPMRGITCANIDDEVSRGQEIQRKTYVACFGVDDVGINVKLLRDSQAKGVRELEGGNALKCHMLHAQASISYL
jgi:hypothetical protein